MQKYYQQNLANLLVNSDFL